MPDQTTLPDLYALCVGINRYPNLGSRYQLGGCVNDVNLVRQLLEENYMQAKFQNIHLHDSILDEAATKENIVKAFRSHFKPARKGDFVLFYYSGHGIREKTPYKAFQEEEVDANIGGILCTDYNGNGRKDPDDTVLCDKELRYLIRELAEEEDGSPRANVIALFDCCHSGSNTRSVLTEEIPTRARQAERRAIGERAWEGFLFHEQPGLKEKVDQEMALEEILPQGEHIMMAACLEVELAWEAAGTGQSNGAFTQALTEVVRQHRGDITYHDLHTRILNQMRYYYKKGERFDQRQTPQFYIKTKQPNDRYKVFLTNQRASQTGDCTVDFNKAEGEWRISLGALHGVPPDSDKQGVTAMVFPRSRRQDRKEASIKKVYPMHSVIELPAGFSKEDGPFLGNVEGLAIPRLKVFLAGAQEGVKLAQKALGELMDKAKRQLFELVKEEGAADYVLRAEDGKYGYYLPFEPGRPLVRATPYRDSSGREDGKRVEEVFNIFNQIAEWAFLKNLNHFKPDVPASLKGKTSMYPMELRLFEYTGNGGERELKPEGNTFTFAFSEDKPHAWIRFELKNHSNDQLHASLAYMPYNFGFYADDDTCFLQGGPQVLIDKGGEAYSRLFGEEQPEDNTNGKIYVKLEVDAYTRSYNLQVEQSCMKLLSSKTPFEIKSLHMDPLPLPDDPSTRSFGGLGKGFKKEKKEEPFEWEIRTFDLIISNPEYDPGK